MPVINFKVKLLFNDLDASFSLKQFNFLPHRACCHAREEGLDVDAGVNVARTNRGTYMSGRVATLVRLGVLHM